MLASREMLETIGFVNRELGNAGKGESLQERLQRRRDGNTLTPVSLPSRYQIEFMHDLKSSDLTVGRYTYKLRVVRSEMPGTVVKSVPETQIDGTVVTINTETELQGAHHLISEYSVGVCRGRATASLNTYMAPKCMGDDGLYLYKGFATLLLHLLVYCCAWARLRQEIDAQHPATIKLYSRYCKDGYATVGRTVDDEFGVTVEYCIDSSKTPNGLSDELLAGLRTSAMLNIQNVLKKMIASKSTTLNASRYIVPLIE